jgi:hypothetical protein
MDGVHDNYTFKLLVKSIIHSYVSDLTELIIKNNYYIVENTNHS